jgi:uncharacterized protein (DUF1697 family)
MNAYIALLRAVNAGGTGKLPMSNLKELCVRAGFLAVRTYIASGNVGFASRRSEARVKAALESVGVLVRTAAEMAAVVAGNPFPGTSHSRTLAIFLGEPPPRDAAERATDRADEEIRLGSRGIYVHYGDGMGRSRLKIPAARPARHATSTRSPSSRRWPPSWADRPDDRSHLESIDFGVVGPTRARSWLPSQSLGDSWRGRAGAGRCLRRERVD